MADNKAAAAAAAMAASDDGERYATAAHKARARSVETVVRLGLQTSTAVETRSHEEGSRGQY